MKIGKIVTKMDLYKKYTKDYKEDTVYPYVELPPFKYLNNAIENGTMINSYAYGTALNIFLLSAVDWG